MPNYKMPMKMYGKGKSPIMNLGFIKAETLKKNPDATTMNVDGKTMPIKMYDKAAPTKNYKKGYYGA